MNRLALVLCSALLALATGCFFGDRVGNGRTISLKFPALDGQSQPSLLANSPEVQESLQFIGTIVNKEGLVLDPNPPGGRVNCIAYFSEGDRYCRVYLNERAIRIVLFEYGRGQGSESFRRLSKSLQQELEKHYGAKRVKVGD